MQMMFFFIPFLNFQKSQPTVYCFVENNIYYHPKRVTWSGGYCHMSGCLSIKSEYCPGIRKDEEYSKIYNFPQDTVWIPGSDQVYIILDNINELINELLIWVLKTSNFISYNMSYFRGISFINYVTIFWSAQSNFNNIYSTYSIVVLIV